MNYLEVKAFSDRRYPLFDVRLAARTERDARKEVIWMEDLEKAGRFLCKAYYNGELKPSAAVKEGSGEYWLARCVENVLADEKGRRGNVGAIWRQLMAGDLRGLNTHRRRNLLGGGGERRAEGAEGVERSVDGREGVSDIERSLYIAVGLEWQKLARP